MQIDTILKKYSSTVATIFTGIASAALFGHTLTANFVLGISVVFISMHQVIVDESGFSVQIWVWSNFIKLTIWLRECFCIFPLVLFTPFKGQRSTTKWDSGINWSSWQPQVFPISIHLSTSFTSWKSSDKDVVLVPVFGVTYLLIMQI